MQPLNWLLLGAGLALFLPTGIWTMRNPPTKGQPWTHKRKLMIALQLTGAALLIANFFLHVFG
ncbi:hypothetical protein [Herbiconiux flava]|uniref:HIG1 domain-containing protein n=1 Tax=Herbiconiux flava TaxID=881268 RepID=A0A852SN29_9MICO|nr:hypothetical protein [Herbiconiux flava]NYD70217.1 hypothetical protein [Herbiconiux flava]GLK16969.1 hypothetical protein GCM10017602_14510 [Herbiconiux flava]